MYMYDTGIDFASVSAFFGFYFGTASTTWDFFVFLFNFQMFLNKDITF